MMLRRINVLFTGAGGAGTIYLLKHLKKYKYYRTVAVDMNPYAVGLYIADKGYTVPPVTDPSYISIIQEIVEKDKIDIVVPLIDEELLSMWDLKKKIQNIEVLLPRREFVEMTLDKLKTSIEFRKAGIPVPETYNLGEFLCDDFYPAVVKPRHGRGSKGREYLYSPQDLECLANRKTEKNELIVQRMISGREFTTSVVVTKNGDILSIVPKEVISKIGITKVGVTREVPAVADVCRKIQENFRADGPFNVQLILDKNSGTPYVIEVNPRFSTTVVLTTAAGVDEVDLLIRDRLDMGVPKVKPFKKNLVMIRYEDQIFIDERLIKKGVSR